MAVRDVVDDLANGPATGPVGRVELGLGHTGDGRANLGRSGLDFVDETVAFFGCYCAGPLEFSNRVLKVHVLEYNSSS